MSQNADSVRSLDAVVEEASQRRHRLFTEEGIIVDVHRHSFTMPGGRGDVVDVICRRPQRQTRLDRGTLVNRMSAPDATDEAIIRAVYGDQHIFDTGPPPVVEVENLGDCKYRVKVTS